jgi:hypothetical protein
MKKQQSKKENKTKKIKRKRGARTKYDPEVHPLKAWILGVFGKVNKEIAAELSISTGTLDTWQKKHPEFLSAVREGKAIANAKVVKALYTRCIGSKYPEKKIVINPDGTLRKEVTEKEVIPDVAAIKLWLLNRDPDNWKEKIDHTIGGPDGKPIAVKILRAVSMEDL